jgi:hypothetical protein
MSHDWSQALEPALELLHQFASMFMLSNAVSCGIAGKLGFCKAVSISGLTSYENFLP